ncbi:MAG: hypothetical protein AABM64_11180 [Pseudomonadota bacterium]
MKPLDHAELKDRFYLALGRLVHAYSSLDFNVGIALGWLGPHNGVDVRDLLIGRVPLADRLEALKPLVLKMYRAAGNDALAEFEAWFAKVCKLKAIRNDYVHARWGLPGELDSDDPILKMLPMNWDFSADRLDKSVDVPLSELESQSSRIGQLVDDFAMLRAKFAAYAVPAHWKK